MSTAKEMQQMREQLEQQALQTRQALSQLMLVREQLISETNARIEAQVRNIFTTYSPICEYMTYEMNFKIIISNAGKNPTVVTTEQRIIGTFGLIGWIQREWTHGPNISQYRTGTTGNIIRTDQFKKKKHFFRFHFESWCNVFMCFIAGRAEASFFCLLK